MVIAVTCALTLRVYVGQAFVIPSGSMRPQLVEHDRVLVSKMSYRLHDIRRGDVLVFETVDETKADTSVLPVRLLHRVLEAVALRQPPHTDFIKRVVGLPGEVVEARNCRLYVDGMLLDEPYLADQVCTDDFGPVRVPRHTLWMMGDNRKNSSDSRVRGPIPIDDVVGRAILRVWPPNRWAFL